MVNSHKPLYSCIECIVGRLYNSVYLLLIIFMYKSDTFKHIFFMWAIHTTLYRICCIEYTRLFVNAQCYTVLCISKCRFLAFKQFDSTKPIQLLKNIWKNVYKCVGFLHQKYQQQAYTVVQSSNNTLNTTAYVNWSMKKKNVYMCNGFLHENYQQQAYTVV